MINHKHTEYDFTLYSSDKESIISFYFEEYLHDILPSLSCCIDIQDGEFKGFAYHVWFEINELENFIKELSQLNITRHGKASLYAMSPEEFNITLESINRRDDLILRYNIGQARYVHGSNHLLSLSGVFEYDSEYFNTLLEDFLKLLSIEQLGKNNQDGVDS